MLRKVEYRDAGETLAVNDTFTYDDLLRRKGSSSRYGVDQSMVYDDRGQLQSESTTYGGQTYTVSYDRDARGRMEKVTYPSGTYVNYTYTERGLLDTIKVDGSEIEDRGYNDLGQLTSVERPSIDEARSYDDRGQVTSREKKGDAAQYRLSLGDFVCSCHAQTPTTLPCRHLLPCDQSRGCSIDTV